MKPQSLIRVVLTVVFFAVGIYLLVNVVNNVNRSSILRKELQEYQSELENLKAENTSSCCCIISLSFNC